MNHLIFLAFVMAYMTITERLASGPLRKPFYYGCVFAVGLTFGSWIATLLGAL